MSNDPIFTVSLVLMLLAMALGLFGHPAVVTGRGR